jgi:hypothetical protein
MSLIVNVHEDELEDFVQYLTEKHLPFHEVSELHFSQAECLVSIILPTTLTAAQIVAQYFIQRHVQPRTGDPKIRAHLDGKELDLENTKAESLPEMVKTDAVESRPAPNPDH